MTTRSGPWTVQFDPSWYYLDKGTGGTIRFEQLEGVGTRHSVLEAALLEARGRKLDAVLGACVSPCDSPLTVTPPGVESP